jgi:putative methyltransferase (TIGR04325 family)
MASAKDVLRLLTPPILWQMAHRLKSHFWLKSGPFEGPFSSWEAAVSRSDGWDSPEITDQTLNAALKVRDGLLEFEQDGVARKKIIYSETILAFLLLVLSRHKDILNIIDFGGGLGSNYFQNRKILRQLAATSVRWNIVERPIFAKLGIEHFQTAELTFYSILDDVLLKVKPIPDALLFSSSLQYVADPFSLLDQVVNVGIRIIALDRLRFWPGYEHAVFIQHPDPNLHYQATYPIWIFSKDTFVAWLVAKGFMSVEHFTSDPDPYFNACGMIFIRQL